MVDDGPRHFLAEFAARVREHAGERETLLIAEDARNLAHIVRAEADGGWGMDAVWADDFHHQMRRILAGDAEGYFADFTDRVEDLAVSLRRGWFFAGQHAGYFGAPRGTDPAGLEARRFVFFLQNHDQIGNRARGDRLHHVVPLPALRAATALLLCAPQTPLLFMGQEWGATAPFQFFTDHAGELGELVRQGRTREFDRFPSFVAAGQDAGVPDPQAPDTFTRSVLDWEERSRAPHEHLLRLHRDLLELRRSDPALALPPRGEPTVHAAGDDSIVMARSAPGESELVLVARLRGEGEVAIPEAAGGASGDSWESVLDTEEAAYAPDPRPIEVAAGGAPARVIFRRPGAILLRRERGA
jgi:maltooligosyltrehalose trehalohydrolase